MSREAPWFKLYAARWLGDRNIRHMTPEQRGYLIQLFCEAWESDPAGTLPADSNTLWKLAGATSRKRFEKVCEPVLAQFKLHEGRYFLADLIEQHEGLARMHESRTRAAVAGAQARWGDSKGTSSALPNAQKSHCQSEQNKKEQEQHRSDAIPGTRAWDLEQQKIAQEQDKAKVKKRLRLV